MGVARFPREDEDLSEHSLLTTKLDAYLNVDQPGKAVIQVAADLFEEGGQGFRTLDKLLPGQRVGASAWFEMAKGILSEANLESYPKKPTVFKDTEKERKSAMILHADDGLLASTASERDRIVKVFGSQVTVQVGDPMVGEGDSFEFLKRRYIRMKEGIAVFSNAKYLEALIKAAGPNIKRRDAPADGSFQDAGCNMNVPALCTTAWYGSPEVQV
eukprot:s2160_g12.t1